MTRQLTEGFCGRTRSLHRGQHINGYFFIDSTRNLTTGNIEGCGSNGGSLKM
jgi:hypothetical protein